MILSKIYTIHFLLVIQLLVYGCSNFNINDIIRFEIKRIKDPIMNLDFILKHYKMPFKLVIDVDKKKIQEKQQI